MTAVKKTPSLLRLHPLTLMRQPHLLGKHHDQSLAHEFNHRCRSNVFVYSLSLFVQSIAMLCIHSHCSPSVSHHSSSATDQQDPWAQAPTEPALTRVHAEEQQYPSMSLVSSTWFQFYYSCEYQISLIPISSDIPICSTSAHTTSTDSSACECTTRRANS